MYGPVMSNLVLVKIGPRTINFCPVNFGSPPDWARARVRAKGARGYIGLGNSPKHAYDHICSTRTEIACKIGLGGTNFVVNFFPPGPILIRCHSEFGIP